MSDGENRGEVIVWFSFRIILGAIGRLPQMKRLIYFFLVSLSDSFCSVGN